MDAFSEMHKYEQVAADLAGFGRKAVEPKAVDQQMGHCPTVGFPRHVAIVLAVDDGEENDPDTVCCGINGILPAVGSHIDRLPGFDFYDASILRAMQHKRS